MKVLVMYVDEFSYVPSQKNIEEAEDFAVGADFKDSILAFIQVEASDEGCEKPGEKNGESLKMDCKKK